MSNADKYVIEKRTGESDWDVVATVEGVKSYRVEGLTPGTQYDFRVKGVNIIDDVEHVGEYSDVVSVSTLSELVVGVPADFAASMGFDRADLSWSVVEGATGYEVEYKTLAEPSWTQVSRTDQVSQSILNLSEGVEYQFKVRAVIVYSSYTFYSDYSSIVQDSTVVRTPDVPADLSAEGYGDSVEVTWGVSSLATKYILESRLTDGVFSEIYSGTDFSFRHLDLTVNTDYFYRVKAVREINGIVSESGFSSEVSVNSGQIRLAVPSNFSLDSSDYTSADFSWGAVPHAISYEISYLKGESDEFVVAGTFEGTTANISNLSDGYSYKFRIRAIGEDDLFSDYSDLLDVSLPLYELSAPILDSSFSIEGSEEVFNNPNLDDLSAILAYRFSVDTDVDFAEFFMVGVSEDGMDFIENSNPVGDFAGVYLSLFDLEKENTEYFVRGRFKRSVDGMDYFSDYSNVISFTTGLVLPGELYQVDKVVDGLSVTFSWVYNEHDNVSEGVQLSYQVSGDSLEIGSDLTVMGDSTRGSDSFEYTFSSAGTYDVVLKTYRVVNDETIYTDRLRVFWRLNVS